MGHLLKIAGLTSPVCGATGLVKRSALSLVLASSLTVGVLPSAHAQNGPPGFSAIVQKVSPAVVSLNTTKGLGSGFVVDPAGYIVTNNHVLSGLDEADVRFHDGSTYKARLVGRDEATDIALLKINPSKPVPSVTFGNDRAVKVGDWVIAVGNPLGLGGTVTAGILSARDRSQFPGAQTFTDYIQLDAAINPGNSGGPTFDMAGRVIGMNTMGRASPWGGAAAGIGFAIPSSTIQRVIGDLKTGGVVTRGYLGVVIESLSEEEAKALGLPNANGALVTDVIDGSPAQKGGIKRGDVILKINGQIVRDNRDGLRKIAALQVGQTATFVLWRNNAQISVSVTVVKRDAVAQAETGGSNVSGAAVSVSSLGLNLQIIQSLLPQAASAGTAGVVVTSVDPSSDAAIRGLQAGDRIVAIGNKEVHSLSDVNLAIEEAKALNRGTVLVFIETQLGVKARTAIKLQGK